MEHLYFEKFRGFEAIEGFCCKFIYWIVEFRDKSFVLNLKLLFIIVDCFLGRFSLKVFIVKLVCFIGFRRSSYLVLFTIPLCMILMFVCLNKNHS